MERSTKGGLIVVGSLNLRGSVQMIPNPVAVAELAVERSRKARLNFSCRSRCEGSFSTSGPTGRNGHQGEYRVLRGPGGRIYEGNSRMSRNEFAITRSPRGV
jgi:hypothetical protein